MRFLGQRLLVLIPTLFLASYVVFMLLHLAPGDPAVLIAGDHATSAQLAEIRGRLGLDDPLFTQYWRWLTDVLSGDLGASLISQVDVVDSIRRAVAPTITIVIGGMAVAVAIGVPLGVMAARRANTRLDAVISTLSAGGVAMPSFWLALILVSLFSIRLGWLPATGFVSVADDPIRAIKHLALPAFAVGVVGAAEITRQLRAAMIDVLATDHIRTLRAKGLSERRIIWLHGLRNAGVPLLTIVGLQVNRLLGGTVVVEAVFGIAGLGSLVVRATLNRDFPIVQGVVLIMVVVVVVTNIVIDALCIAIDPRISK